MSRRRDLTANSSDRDRAAVVTTAVLQVIRVWRHRENAGEAARSEIETLLRDEFADVARATLHEIRQGDG